MTGFGDMMKAKQEKPPGVDAILSKPVTLHGLREVVEKVMMGERG